MEQSQRKIHEAQSQGQQVSDDIQQLQLLQQKAMNNETLNGFFKAQEEFSKVMEKANQIITRELFS
ncbi:MAG: YlbF family regulator [Clostridiales bacterium]|jgi:cell fate (sporulation/competence/biofilm development) regulator YlbF (YheA/YmcA/DUF963 family)|nr:YlbF family regulator [Clostridiales bacterium]